MNEHRPSPYVFPGITEIYKDGPQVKDAFQFRLVIKCVADVFHLPPFQLMAKTRERLIVDARNMAIYILKMDYDMKVIQLGQLFRKDHSTISHSTKKVTDLMGNEPDYRAKYELIKSQLDYKQSA